MIFSGMYIEEGFMEYIGTFHLTKKTSNANDNKSATHLCNAAAFDILVNFSMEVWTER